MLSALNFHVPILKETVNDKLGDPLKYTSEIKPSQTSREKPSETCYVDTVQLTSPPHWDRTSADTHIPEPSH